MTTNGSDATYLPTRKSKVQEEIRENNETKREEHELAQKDPSATNHERNKKHFTIINDLRWRYQPTSTLSAKYKQSSRQVHARLCSFYAIQPASTLPAYALPHYSLANVYAIQPASALPAYSLPALLAGKYICDPAGKYIARLRVARITRWQMYLRSSRQAPCPPTLCWPYLANLRRTLNIVKPATPLPAYALPAALDRWIVNAHYALNDNL